MRLITYIFAALIFGQLASAQVGIGTTTPQARLDVAASDVNAPAATDGLLIPRIDAFPAIDPAANQHAMMVYYTGVSGTHPAGFYFWDNPASVWKPLATPINAWNVTGNNAVSGTNFIGTINPEDVDFRTNNIVRARLTQHGQLEFLNNGGSVFIGENAGEHDDETNNQNVFIGFESGRSNTSGYSNAGVGYQSLQSLTTGSGNTAMGHRALASNNTGNNNLAAGKDALYQNTTGHSNTALGHSALSANTISYNNTAIGAKSLRQSEGNNNTAVGVNSLEQNAGGYAAVAIGVNALQSNTTGFFNTATGYSSLRYNTTGSYNTAVGVSALGHNTTGYRNTASGMIALEKNTEGINNTATGYSALSSNTEGSQNSAHGAFALSSNLTGANNTAAGRSALLANTTGSNNTATGTNTLAANESGSNNTASGAAAMFLNTTGDNNAAYGRTALYYNTTGSYNSSFGLTALRNNTTGQHNSGFGASALQTNETGIRLTGVGRLADVSQVGLTNGTVIGANAILNASYKIRLGSPTVTVVEGAVPYSNPSDARFKFDIKDNVPGLDFIMNLRPVTYKFDTSKFRQHVSGKASADADLIPQSEFDAATSIVRTGFLAQEVEATASRLGYEFDGIHTPDPSNPTDNYSIAYSQFVMPLVKAVQEQQQTIESQADRLENLQSENAKLRALLDKQQQTLQAIESRLNKLER